MNKQIKYPALHSTYPSGARVSRSAAGSRGRQRIIPSQDMLTRPEANHQLNDMVTEAAGLARNKDAWGYYAGSF
ncbi:hypothetical protein GCM10011375_16020 [Hymenobacter qilianensis]|uniref:Uncharacterized protein n=2 Tax=Hymenobacter qilianensis TaxID=1385715 RepID=A0ACB5PQB9_9BACT|nr:hypothetical protein [Hymenobacter qilianensis]QNP51813.1 hypothetical protein H9L05_17975 [Hymenobacter qilianensis]GGF61807.1 hypothetical protein GCM10011375_16020 [Hymenobacter qilianensis]